MSWFKRTFDPTELLPVDQRLDRGTNSGRNDCDTRAGPQQQVNLALGDRTPSHHEGRGVAQFQKNRQSVHEVSVVREMLPWLLFSIPREIFRWR